MDKEIEYLMMLEVDSIKAKCLRLSNLCKRYNIDSKEKLADLIELADLFRECNRNEWINLKEE